MSIDLIVSIAEEENMLFVDGFDKAILGIATRSNSENVLAYSVNEILNILMTRDNMSYREALDYYSFNIEGAWCGPMTPIFVNSYDDEYKDNKL